MTANNEAQRVEEFIEMIVWRLRHAPPTLPTIVVELDERGRSLTRAQRDAVARDPRINDARGTDWASLSFPGRTSALLSRTAARRAA